MTYRYDSEQIIPKNVIEAIRFTGKVGFISREIWHEYFGVGNYRWQKRQFQFLIERGYFKKHRNEFAKGIFIVTEKSARLLNQMKLSCVSPVPVMYLAHDIVVAKSILALMRSSLIFEFKVERELKTYGIKDYLLSEKDHDQKYPDAIFKMYAYGGERTVAVEYERERKSTTRYKSILWQYSSLSNLSMVLYVCENIGTQKIIEGALKYLGQTALKDKLAFVSADEWKKSASDAVIQLSSQRIKLREICSRIDNESLKGA